jgi:hypothetical protein
MSSYTPPLEYPTIFDANLFPKTTAESSSGQIGQVYTFVIPAFKYDYNNTPSTTARYSLDFTIPVAGTYIIICSYAFGSAGIPSSYNISNTAPPYSCIVTDMNVTLYNNQDASTICGQHNMISSTYNQYNVWNQTNQPSQYVSQWYANITGVSTFQAGSSLNFKGNVLGLTGWTTGSGNVYAVRIA